MILNLKKGWSVTEDIHSKGEIFGIYREDFDPTIFGPPTMKAIPPFEPLARLEHLQLSKAENPYYGFGLRQFNAYPWWYKNVFTVEEPSEFAVLHFKGVDYFADVYLNGTFLGSHEGYNTPFSFEVGKLLKKGENLLVVKVSAPLDFEIADAPDSENFRFLFLIRNQMKGTYEHSDTFLPRDVNPLGIWDEVTLTLYGGLRNERKPMIEAVPEKDFTTAQVKLSYLLRSGITANAKATLVIREAGETVPVCREEFSLPLENGEIALEKTLTVENPKLWNVWERGLPNRYEAILTVRENETELYRDTETFGIRSLELFRTKDEMYFILNGEKIYLRGTTYFPDVYISAMSHGRYLRDIENAKRCGMNTLRIHVHSEKDEFYDLCDEYGMLLIQDSDFNWTHPTTEEWTERAVKMYEDMIIRLKNHPSVISWICMNESRLASYKTERPGPQMLEATKRLDPLRPFILDSWDAASELSGDSHNYEGSLHGQDTHYTNIFSWKEKFNTEFGMDAPPVWETLREEPEIKKIIPKVLDGTDSIQYYQYRYLKYFIEHFRIQKFSPCAAHFQFLFTDPAPTSLFGVYDRLGVPKYAVRAFYESNQPVGILMETEKEKPHAVYVVNDLLSGLGTVRAVCRITDENEKEVFSFNTSAQVAKNSLVKVAPIDFLPDPKKEYRVSLKLFGTKDELLCENVYEKAFNPPEHVKGHPYQMHHGLALRTYWEWL